MKSILWLRRIGRDAGGELGASEPARVNVRVALDIAFAVREHEVQLALRTGELPCAQRVDHDRGERDLPPGRVRFWRADRVPAIGALPHGQHLALEVDSLPSQSAQLTRAQPAE